MHKYFFLVVILIFLPCNSTLANDIPEAENQNKGDANNDDVINIQDIVVTINTVLKGKTTSGDEDCNNDGAVNIQDIICTINVVLEGDNNFPTNNGLYLGIGGYEFCKGENEHSVIHREQCQHDEKVYVDEFIEKIVPNVNAVTFWINRNWDEQWYDIKSIQTKIIDKGYTPVFIFYWFANDISPAFIEERKADYFTDLNRMVDFLNQLNGDKIVILNPEFNKNGVESYEPFNDLLIESINLVKSVEKTKVSFCLGDFGDYQLLSDDDNWGDFHPSIYRAIQEVDFISFQEMRGSTRNSTEEILNTPKRTLSFAKYLTEKYQKPTFLAFFALSSYGADGEAVQEQVYQEFLELMPQLVKQGGLMGFSPFNLMDDPRQAGFYNEAEKHFGLLNIQGKPKPALKYFKEINL